MSMTLEGKVTFNGFLFRSSSRVTELVLMLIGDWRLPPAMAYFLAQVCGPVRVLKGIKLLQKQLLNAMKWIGKTQDVVC